MRASDQYSMGSSMAMSAGRMGEDLSVPTLPRKPQPLLPWPREGRKFNDEQLSSYSSTGLSVAPTVATTEDAASCPLPNRRKSADLELLRPKALTKSVRRTVAGDEATAHDQENRSTRESLKDRLHLDLTSLREPSSFPEGTREVSLFPPPLPPDNRYINPGTALEPRSSVITEPTPMPIHQLKFPMASDDDCNTGNDRRCGRESFLGEVPDEPRPAIVKRRSLVGCTPPDEGLVRDIKSSFVCVSGLDRADLHLLVSQLDRLQFTVDEIVETESAKQFVKLHGGRSERSRILRRGGVAIFDHKGTLVQTVHISDPEANPDLRLLLADHLCPGKTHTFSGSRGPSSSWNETALLREASPRCVGLGMTILMKIHQFLLMLVGLLHWGECLFLPSPFDDDFSPRRGSANSNLLLSE